MAARSRPRALCQPCTSPGSRSHASTSRYLCKRISHTADTRPPSQVTLRAGTSWSQVIDGVQCRVNVVRERGKRALMVTAGIGSGLDYDKFRIKCPRTPSRTHIASRIEDSSILSWKMHASLCKLSKFSPWLAPIGARGCKIFTPGGAPQKAPPKRTKLGFHCVT